MKFIHLSFLTVLLMFAIACNSTKSASSSTDSSKSTNADQMQNLNPSIDLADHLKKVPGLTVTGSGGNAKVAIRGMATPSGDAEPLFVINNNPITGGLSEANSIVSVADIKSVTVLKTPSETSAYGIRGSNGVILIKLKDQ